MAYNKLKEKFINCMYEPGTILNEAQLAEDLGYSRTPIREALTRIEDEGFIRIIPKKGIYVTDVTLQDVMQIFQTRLEIEPIALRMAGPSLPMDELLSFRESFSREEHDVGDGFRMDTAMHLFFIEHCGNRFIIDMMRKVFDENTRVIISSKQNETKIHDARIEHLQIINLLIAQNYAEAQQAMFTHIETCKKAALDYFYNSKSFSVHPSTTYRNQLNIQRGNQAL